jgi:uncharacterized protein YyaL (SSP411 family)
VAIKYLGSQVLVHAGSAAEECELRLAAFLKEAAISKGLLPSFLLESDLGHPDKASEAVGSVEPEVVSRSLLARTKINKIWDSYSGSDSCVLKKLLSTKAQFVTSIDSTATLEVAWLTAMVDTSGEQMLQSAILQLFPEKMQEVRPSIKGIVQAVESITTKPLYRMSTKALQGAVSAVLDILRALHSGRCPVIDLKKVSSWMAAVVSRMSSSRRASPSRWQAGMP